MPIWTTTGLITPGIIGALYAVLMPFGIAQTEGGGYLTIPQVRALLASDVEVTVGWFHYIAFDLFVGTWIAREGVARNMPARLLVPCLLITVLFGPAGFLLFVLLRIVWLPSGTSDRARV